ncbi:MAG: diacylglycerol kinase family lipid kinase [Chloroflexota bacterium]|nr:diacylglycerol kinase family lipid kinase [Chloroflexota bacterium]
MQATLIYNQGAGSANQMTAADLQTALQAVGFSPVYRATAAEDDLDNVLEDTEGLIIVAGGDGTIRAVATRLLDGSRPLAILPLGTANNIATNLGMIGTLPDMIGGLQNPSKCGLDVGRIRGPWGEDYFLEGAGFGFFANAMANFEPEKGKSVLRAVTSFVKTYVEYPTYQTRLLLDGQDFSGTYTMVEVFNTNSIGPRLKFTPAADPCDGWFDIVRVRSNEGVAFIRYVTNLMAEQLGELPNVDVTRTQHVELAWAGFPLHFDDIVRQATPDEQTELALNPAIVTIDILPQAIELWLPQGNG